MVLSQIRAPGTPSEVARRLTGEGSFWLDASPGPRAGRAASPAPNGRFSYWGVAPVETRVVRAGDAVRWLDAARALGSAPHGAAREAHAIRVPRWVGFVSYDAGAADPVRWPQDRARPEKPLRAPATTPRLWFGRYDAVLIHDSEADTWLIAADDNAARSRLEARLAGPAPEKPRARVTDVEEADPAAHLARVERALAEIRDGNIYQINLARPWRGRFEGAPLALAEAMAAASPVPLGFYLEGAGWAVISRSMETFFDWSGQGGGRLVTRPIKGTVPSSAADAARQASAMLTDTKELAEHAMVIDLMRNDVGAVAKPGSVRVTEHMAVEPYRALSHLVSTVAAETREGVTLADVLEAMFPPGSVTGTPKLRAMELIDALEEAPRGVYTGAVGFVDQDGGACFAVAIRTATVESSSVEGGTVAEGTVTYAAGGGVVEASVPERELAETTLKARVFLDAVNTLEAAEPVASRSGQR